MSSLFATAGYSIRTTRNAQDIESAQRLRYEIFNLELGEGLASSLLSGLDADPFDAQCDHLIIEDESGCAIGTYRLQTGTMAAAGRGYYSSQEFDFSPYESIRHQILELGRACVHIEHRNRSVIDLLWRGIARYAENCGARYLIGCSSLTSQDPAEGWTLYRQLAEKYLAPSHLRTEPIGDYVMPPAPEDSLPVVTPKLFAAYLSIGSMIAGSPALDREFKTIDFLTILDIENMSRAGKNRYFKGNA
jgi:putative hemolysin